LQIAQVLRHVDQEQELLKSKCAAVTKLSQALLQRLMSRELSVASLDLSALS
jgi:hypothetical protein